MNVTSTKKIIKKYGFKFNKGLGQNFLIDDTVLKNIIEAAEITDDDFIIEIGPGIGALTKELLKKAKSVCSIEIDDCLIPILNEELGQFDNFNLIHKDALKLDFNEIIGDEQSVKLVANLPYYVTTPIVNKLLTKGYKFKSLIIMVQKEVAERMAAKPNCKEYGSLTLLVQYYCDVNIIRKVSPSSFLPQPKVDSIILKLERLEKPRIDVKDEDLFFSIIKNSFNMRRKTLWNGLKFLNIDKDLMEKAFELSEINPQRRGETLSIEEFGKLSDCIYSIK